MSEFIPSSAETQLAALQAFRRAAYDCLRQAQDALFELVDAALLTPAVTAFAELSCAPVFRRRWPSLYEALQDGRPARAALLKLYVGLLPTQRLIVAGDHTAWSRLAAPTLRERTIEHQPTPVPGNRPITVGYGYSTLVGVPESRGSWALPLLHERITPAETPIAKAVAQLAQLCKLLAVRPLSLWDSEYGCAPFILASAAIQADKLIRLRPNLCLWGPPPAYGGKGRPREHGAKFKLSDATTWGPPAEQLVVDDAELGRVEVALWRGVHLRKAKHHPLRLVRIHRPAAADTRRARKDLWVAWHGEEPPPLAEWWRTYLRRFAVDHWYRFAKQRLHWTLPHLATPEQADRWSDLMPLMTWQLWLARAVVADNPLPWQKPQGAVALTPGRVCRGLGGVLAAIGTPTQAPKPRGKSPGWPKGRERHPADATQSSKRPKRGPQQGMVHE